MQKRRVSTAKCGNPPSSSSRLRLISSRQVGVTSAERGWEGPEIANRQSPKVARDERRPERTPKCDRGRRRPTDEFFNLSSACGETLLREKLSHLPLLPGYGLRQH